MNPSGQVETGRGCVASREARQGRCCPSALGREPGGNVSSMLLHFLICREKPESRVLSVVAQFLKFVTNFSLKRKQNRMDQTEHSRSCRLGPPSR